MVKKSDTYSDILTEAVNHFSTSGYTSPEELAYWTQRLKEAAERELVPEHMLQDNLRSVLTSTYRRLIDQGAVFTSVPGVSRYTLDRVRPELRSELDRRILASASLIKLNREEAINNTLRRFAGWATSIPQGGAAEPEKRKTKADIKKSLTRFPFEERRVLIDQSHKLSAAVSDIVAKGGGAIAAKWKSHWRQANYDYRSDHKDRDYEYNKSRGREQIYLIRNSWADEQSLVKPGKAGYTDQITQPGEEVFCRCRYIYVFNLRDLPVSMLTKKGQAALQEARDKIRSMQVA